MTPEWPRRRRWFVGARSGFAMMPRTDSYLSNCRRRWRRT